MTRRGRIALGFVGGVLFGLLAGWVHGNDGGLRAALGNVSAPWLFVAILPAWWAGSGLRGAVLGAVTTIVALLGFYVSLTAAMLGHLGNTHGVSASFELVLESNRIWFAAGLISGPVCGAVAGRLGARVRTRWLGVAVGLLMVGEVAAIAALQSVRLPLLPFGWAGSDSRVAILEAVVGLATVAVVVATGFRPQAQRD